MQNRKKWMGLAVAGLLLTGAGLSMAIDAGMQKLQGQPWLAYGTFALVVFNAGLCLLVDSVRYK